MRKRKDPKKCSFLGPSREDAADVVSIEKVSYPTFKEFEIKIFRFETLLHYLLSDLFERGTMQFPFIAGSGRLYVEQKFLGLCL